MADRRGRDADGGFALNYRTAFWGFFFGLVLLLLSLVRFEHVNVVDYEAYEYGFPLPWLIYYVNGIVPVNRWIVAPVLIYDLPFWIGAGYLGIFLLSKARVIRTRMSRRSLGKVD